MSSRNKSDVKKLFEFWCEIRCHQGTKRNVITDKFPESFRDEKTISDIPNFAFPCEFGEAVQSFSFVLTTDDSKWRYGFCRQDPKSNSAMVIITYLPWHDTFLKFLAVLAELRRGSGSNKNSLKTFLNEVYNAGVPGLGGNLKLVCGPTNFIFERPMQFQLPSIPENHNLNLYYNFVDSKNMISIFAAMLAERRIIFTSRFLDRLSSCIQAANAFLFPMVWQHIFIPVLPMKLKDYLSAPMPYLIGVPITVLETMTTDELGDVVILNCDRKICENPFDDVNEMPAEIVSQLKKQLSPSQEHIGDRVSKIFLGVLVQLIGGYRDGVEFHEKDKTFNRDKFIESRPSHLRPFLTKIMELQIFQQFIDERLQMLNAGLGFSDEFELEIARYVEKTKKVRNYGFLKNVKEKTNPAVKSAVKSVKESTRGVKTAYKDLKSKFTPPNSTQFRSHLASSSQHDGIDGYNYKKPVVSHSSVPSSPVFNKNVASSNSFQYASPEAINGVAHSMVWRRAQLEATNHYGHASPAVSPASSLCSSEMNLSQELQNHPLFKLPVVDRSLKPSNSSDTKNCVVEQTSAVAIACLPPPVKSRSLLRTAISGKDFITPLSRTNLSLATQYHFNRAHTYLEMRPPSSSTDTSTAVQQELVRQYNEPSTMSLVAGKLITTNSIYDNPPDMKSPPIPPRRHISGNSGSTAALSTDKVNSEQSVSNNFVEYSGMRSNALRFSSLSDTSNSSASTDSTASFVTALSYSQQHSRSDTSTPTPTPTPVPRLKKDKESTNSLQETRSRPILNTCAYTSMPAEAANDLISLDDSNNASFDLEDFDPLNQNAKPLPIDYKIKNSSSKKSTTLPAGTPSSLMYAHNIHNLMQVNSNSTQSHQVRNLPARKVALLVNSIPQPMPSANEDVELLRQYGLDQFSLTVPSTSKSKQAAYMAAPTATASTTTSMSNWTTFD